MSLSVHATVFCEVNSFPHSMILRLRSPQSNSILEDGISPNQSRFACFGPKEWNLVSELFDLRDVLRGERARERSRPWTLREVGLGRQTLNSDKAEILLHLCTYCNCTSRVFDTHVRRDLCVPLTCLRIAQQKYCIICERNLLIIQSRSNSNQLYDCSRFQGGLRCEES